MPPDSCTDCNGKCQDHSAIELQMKNLRTLPNTVSKLTGIVSVIAMLFTLLVGLAFNSHFEQMHQAEVFKNQFEAIGVQIQDIGEENYKSSGRIKERLLLIETRIDSSHDKRKVK